MVLNAFNGWYRFLAALLRVVAENVVTDSQTDRQTDSNPRCACAPRVNELIHVVRPGYHAYCDVGTFVVFAHQAHYLKCHVHTCVYTNVYMYLKEHLVNDTANGSVQQLILRLEFNYLIWNIFIICRSTIPSELCVFIC